MKVCSQKQAALALALLCMGFVSGIAACQCEGTDFKGATCKSLGFRAGNLACSDCTISTNNCVGEPNCIAGSNPEFVESGRHLFWDFSPNSSKRGHKCKKDFGPSDLAVHPKLKKLVVASDEGQYALVDLDGSAALCIDAQGDNEVVIVGDPTSDHIFVGQEYGVKGPGFAQLTEWNAVKRHPVKVWQVAFPGGIQDGDHGMEAGVFVPDDPAVPSVGSFYLGDQSAGVVYGQCRLPLGNTDLTDATYSCGLKIEPRKYGLKEITSLSYDPTSSIGGSKKGVLYLGSNEDNRIVAFAPDGTYLQWVSKFPQGSGPGQEGIAIDGCTAYIASDANKEGQKVWRYPFMTPGSCNDGKQNQNELCADVGGVCKNYEAATETNCGDGLDNDCDGFVDAEDQDCVGKATTPVASTGTNSGAGAVSATHPLVLTTLAWGVSLLQAYVAW